MRFEDHCYEYANNSAPSDIVSNIDVCKDKDSDLWVPGTSAENHFVTQTFPADNNKYHFGIVRYSPLDGSYGVDNSHNPGSHFFSMNTDIKNKAGNLIVGDTAPCFVLDKVTGLWEIQAPCGDATGICKSKLGSFYFVIYLFVLN